MTALVPTLRDAGDAGARAGAVEQHGAGAALPFAAAEAAAGQAEVVAQDRQQAVARLGINLAISPLTRSTYRAMPRILAPGSGMRIGTGSGTRIRIRMPHPHTVEYQPLFPEGG